MNSLEIKYLSYLLEYLNDNDFCNLIKLLTGKTQFYNPHDTCREYFLAFLLRQEDYTTVYDADKFDYTTVIDDRDLFYDTGVGDPEFNSYFRLLEYFKDPFCFEYNNQKFEFDSLVCLPESEEEIAVSVKAFNNIFITDNILVDEKGNLLTRFSKVIRALSEFIVCISDKDRNKFRNYIKTAINNIICNKRCYIPYFVDKDRKITRLDYYNFETDEVIEYQIIEKDNKIYIIKGSCDQDEDDVDNIDLYFYNTYEEIKNYTSVMSDEGHSLLGAKTIDSYNNSIKSLDEARTRLNNKNKTRESCKICNPIEKNTEENEPNMCEHCRKLIGDILKAINKTKRPELLNNKRKNISQPDIVYAIKRKGKGEENCKNIDDIARLHFDNLADYLNKLNKTYHFSNQERIERIVQKAFSTSKKVFKEQ